MNDASASLLLNELLIQTHRSLLQYAAESWPWTADADESVRAEMMSLAKEQEISVREIVDFLRSAHHPIVFGVYPNEYTSLHFVSLGYFLECLKESESVLLGELQSALPDLAERSAEHQLVENVISRQQNILNRLEEIKVASLGVI